MSDITGPPVPPNAIAPVARAADQPVSVNKDPHKAPTGEQKEKQQSKSGTEQNEQAKAREPAVSISATAAHLHIGEELKEQVTKIDAEGRPIIVTETATFALRPDAGLRPGDDVKLEIVEAGKTLAADLLVRNGKNIDPPIRLSLIVIALHGKPASEITRTIETTQKQQTDTTHYRPPQIQASYAKPNAPSQMPPNELETLTALLSNKGGAGPFPTASSLPSQEAAQTENNLSTLLSLQQEMAKVGTVSPQAAPDVGLGPVIQAFTATGAEKQLQVMDVSISNVPPSAVAEVLSVKAVSPEEAKAYALPLTAFAGPLASVETTKGLFILPQAQAENLQGELVRVADTMAASAQQQNTTANWVTAKLYTAAGNQAQAVQINIAAHAMGQSASSPSVIQTEVKTVQTIRSFLTPEGPRSDLKIQTPLGDISLTVSNSFRPDVGEMIQIVLPTAPQSAAPGVLPGEITSLQAWPAMEQATSLLSATTPAGKAPMLAHMSAEGGGKLTNSLLFFLHAAGRGTPQEWVGDVAHEQLKEKSPNLLSLLTSDITKLMNSATDTSGDWRAVLLPFDMRGQDMPLIALLFGNPQATDPEKQQNGEQAERDPAAEGKRFIVEVNFSILGKVQLDGRVAGQSFDLTLRTENPISTPLKQDLSLLFDQALSANAFSGKLNIAEQASFPVQVDEILATQTTSS